MVLEIYTFIAVFYWVALTFYLIINGNKIIYLSSIDFNTNEFFPSVAIIIAVRNEEENLKEALTSVCELDYPDYKIIVVNDRSTDNSGKILEEFKTTHPQISILTIDKLPSGWLGKNHALYTGFNFSQEEYVLFTDGLQQKYSSMQ